MIDAFIIKLILSFVVGSSWVTITTIIAEKFGSKIGGLVGGLPSTSAIMLFFVAITQNIDSAVSATTMLPLFYCFNAVFLILFALLAKKGLGISFFSSIFAWGLLAAILVWSKYNNFVVALISWIITLILTIYIFEKKIKLKSHKKVKIKYTTKQIFFRAFLSGAIICLGVFLAKLGGPIYGAVFAAFPAMFCSTLIISYLSSGYKFARSLTKSLGISGMINIPIYSLAVRYTYPLFGILFGTIVSLLMSVFFGYITFNILKKMM